MRSNSRRSIGSDDGSYRRRRSRESRRTRVSIAVARDRSVSETRSQRSGSWSETVHVPKKRRFLLSGHPETELQCEDAPWEVGSRGTTKLPEYVEQRIVSEATPTAQERNRMHVWGMVKLAEARSVAEDILFRSSGPGKLFVLRAPFASPIPLQQVHVGPGAIPDDLADIPIPRFSGLLYQLNDILGTEYDSRTPGIKKCLQHLSSTCRDFGELYGTVRPWWGGNLDEVPDAIATRKAELETMRRNAARGTYIETSRVPLRRVWDLYSNRVLPFHVLPLPHNSDPSTIPPNIWLLSHVWVPVAERDEVWTSINGRQFPIPLPRATTLQAIRIELLNLGAEYIWVDILCMRQAISGDVNDVERQQEWRIDIPSIGYIFRSSSRPCVTYLSGIGMPLDATVSALADSRHWLNRVWTLQEATEGWLPGGLTGAQTPESAQFFARLKSTIRLVHRPRQLSALIAEIKSLYCTREIDRIYGLAYIFRCPTLPMFDLDVNVEIAWDIHLKHMPSAIRTSIFLQYESDDPFEPCVSWKKYHGSTPTLPPAYPFAEESLHLLNSDELDTGDPGIYTQRGYVIGPCHIHIDSGSAYPDGTQDVELHFNDRRQTTATIRISGMHGVIDPDVPYMLLGVGRKWREHWVVFEIVRESRSRRTSQSVVEAIKWAVFHVNKLHVQVLDLDLPGESGVLVQYLNAKEGRARTGYYDQYMAIFDKQHSKKAKTRRFEIGDSPVNLACEDAPWVTSKAHGTTTVLPSSIQGQITSQKGHAADNRIMLWGQIKIARDRETASSFRRDLLTAFAERGEQTFTLRPPTRSTVPLQRVHTGPGVVPSDWADIPCEDLELEEILKRLNSVLGTNYELSKPGLRGCILHFREISRDLGELYGMLRAYWGENIDFHNLLNMMVRLERDLADLRDRTLQDSYLNDHRLPPRRVWDLRSNRVLPLHCIPRRFDDDLRTIPANIWVVSHGWVEDSKRVNVWTPINAKEWSVPIPHDTTTEHIRVELLNMGAEYVWLDVLCLRQERSDDPVREELRKEEWKSDVPTIGYIYHESPSRPCVTYYNGLGLPFETSGTVLHSPRHWFNRAWTLQECVSAWLPGGLTGEQLPGSEGFFARVENVIRSLANTDERVMLIEDMKDRYATKKLDMISGLGYPLQCKTLPIYEVKDEYTAHDIEAAWLELIKHMHPRLRTLIFLLQPSAAPFDPFVSWDTFSAIDPWSSHPSSNRGEDLLLIDSSLLGTDQAGEYYHVGYALGPCRISMTATGKRSTSPQRVELRLADGRRRPIRVIITLRLGVILPQVEYTLVGVGNPWKEYWILAEVVGERNIRGQRTIEAIKWGVLRLDQESAELLKDHDLGKAGTSVMYLSGAEAQRRTEFLNEYLSAFGQF